ncbi:Tetratricopeptide TPR_4 [Actinosynnema mirum DSM 43827]|uniref:Tetratricopeptide TPR_4 n=1 Tax=Actinosynnema mirum (strain ATCC 29888 / DSM 43827 / JCM 3225 / NBRC 14064 / NCIMB 13271 / NRRL B-12336 / IMRU 3971 / 101) TaxID=446462 RepID=C6WPX9_ACTMD|nr:Tetratricopeptide TPR_4 [Actinosynnema mirum DSM 43827]
MCAVDRTPSPAQLLDPLRAVVPLHGRTAELGRLRRWRDSSRGPSLLLLHGPSGVGKTRLAHEAGVVAVVDDADLVPASDLRGALAEHPRLLLIARDAGWWWSAARQRAADLDHTCGELRLDPDPGDFAQACGYYASALGLPAPNPLAGTITGARASGGADSAFRTAFDLHLAALAEVHGVRGGQVELVRWLVSLDPTAEPPPGRLAEDVLAVALLDERINPERTPGSLQILARAAQRWPHVLHRVGELFTARPELASTATAATLAALPPRAVAAVARRVFDDERFHGDPVTAQLTRVLLDGAGEDPVERAELHGVLSARAALAHLREEAVEAALAEVELCRDLADADPVEHRSALADAVGDLAVRLVAAGRPVDALRASEEAVALCELAAAEDEDCLPRLAAALEQLGLRHAGLGDQAASLLALTEACALQQRLAEHNPALFRMDLARVSHQLAVRAFESGKDGAQATDAAVRRWRRVAADDPRYEPDFARALMSAADLLAPRGHRERARALVDEAIWVLRRLADVNPTAFGPQLATALERLSGLASPAEVGEAVKAAGEAVLARREHAARGEEGALAALAGALVGQAALLTGGQRLCASQEAVDIAGRLRGRPAELVVARVGLARALLRNGRGPEAVSAVDDVLEAVRALPRRVLVARADRVTDALHALVDDLAGADHGPTALRLAELVAELWRDLIGHHLGAPVAYAAAVHRVAEHDRPESGRARTAVLLWHLARAPEQLRADRRYADALALHARTAAAEGVGSALEAAHRAATVLRESGAPADLVVGAVDAVVRAHPDPEEARVRLRELGERERFSGRESERARGGR